MARAALEELDFDITYTAVGRIGIAEAQQYKSCPFVVEFDTTEANLKNYPLNVYLISDTEYQLLINEKYNVNRIMRFGEKFEHGSFNFTLHLRNAES